MTWRWKWKIVCQAARPHELRMLKPSGSSAACIRSARRRAASIVHCRSSSETSMRSAECSRGTTSAWPRVAGLMSMKATVCSSEPTICAGTSPATIPQKRQSWATDPQPNQKPATNMGLPVNQPSSQRDGVLARGDLAGVNPRLDLAQQAAELRTLLDLERRGELVAGDRGARRPVAAPVERRGEHLPGEVEVRLDHLRPG